MPALFDRLLIASHNQGKIDEMRGALAPYVADLRDAKNMDLADVDETGATLKDNALLKARAAAEATGWPSLADDSGVFLDALPDQLGVKTKRWSLANGGFPAVFDLVIKAANETGKRGIVYRCVLAIAWPDGRHISAAGEVKGTVARQADPTPKFGFGYDPMFIPDGYENVLTMLSPDVKRQISHRSKAIKRLLEMYNI